MSNNENNSTRLVPLVISEKQKAIITRSIFAIDTINGRGDVIITLNHKYESTKIIFTIDNNKWQKNRKVLNGIAKEKGVHDEGDLELLNTHIDDNWEILISKINDNTTGKNRRLSQADLILQLFKEKSSSILLKDEVNVPHALVKVNDHFETLPIESTKFRRYLSKLYYDNFELVPNSEAIRNVVQQIDGKAFFEGQNITLHLRTAWSNEETKDTIYYDLSDDKNRCVKITSDGWTVLENQTDVLFRRYNHQRPQVQPLTQAEIDKLKFDDVNSLDDVFDQFINLLNIKNPDDRLLLKCYIISLFIPGIAHVILILLGEQGGAKSTLQELVKKLVDPSIIGTLSFPKDATEFIQQLSHNYIVYYDNVSYIPNWISDLLCRAATGSSSSKRALFTNDDDVYYNFRRNIGINSIDLAKINPDLDDRGITLKPDGIDKFDRKKEAVIWKEFNEIKPKLLTYIFNILAKVLEYKKNNSEIKFPNGLNRMADWEEIAEIISRCMGNPDGELQRVYAENISRQVDDAIASSQLCLAIIELKDQILDGKWESSPTDLYEKLTFIARNDLKFTNLSNRKYWPQSAASLTHNLNRVKTILREKRVEVITGAKDEKGNRVIKIVDLDYFSSSPANWVKRSSTSSSRQKENKSSTNQGEKFEDLAMDNGEVSCKSSSKVNGQNQAQNPDSGRLDGLDAVFLVNTEDQKKNDDNNTALVQTSASNPKHPTIEMTHKQFKGWDGEVVTEYKEIDQTSAAEEETMTDDELITTGNYYDNEEDEDYEDDDDEEEEPII